MGVREGQRQLEAGGTGSATKLLRKWELPSDWDSDPSVTGLCKKPGCFLSLPTASNPKGTLAPEKSAAIHLCV